jgi:DNA repair photolyase
MEFDAKRQGTGTKEWCEVTENICLGCANNCLYCYAAANAANPFYGARKQRDDWHNEVLTKRADMTSYPAKKGVVMFPSSHDITPFNLDACVKVLTLMLKKGNRVLIVTKPRFDCVTVLLRELAQWKEQILFRFTIGSMSPLTCKFWEPGAPSPLERLDALELTFKAGFQTSVSIEPMLAGIQSAIGVTQAVYDFVTDTIWIGKMNKARLRVPAGHEGRVKGIESMQSDAEILNLYRALKDMSKIRWKDSIKEVIAKTKETP